MSIKRTFTRGFRTVFMERRVPWILTQFPSLAMQAAFHIVPLFRTRICQKKGLSFEYRPATPDLRVLHEVIDRDDYRLTQNTIQSDAVVIDVGAHIGSFSVLAAAHAPGGMVLSYEPDAANFRLLTRNVSRNGLTNVKTYKCAVAATPGPKTLFLSFSNWAHSLNNLAYSRKVVVDSVTLPQILEENDVRTCHVLKIDCEGSEYEILMGLPPDILRRIERIEGEWHPSPAGQELEFKHLGEFLEAHGFLVEPDPRTSKDRQGTFRATRRQGEL